jgi:hypothetical protein
LSGGLETISFESSVLCLTKCLVEESEPLVLTDVIADLRTLSK